MDHSTFTIISYNKITTYVNNTKTVSYKSDPDFTAVITPVMSVN